MSVFLFFTFCAHLVAAECPSPFADAASTHFWFNDRNLFQLYRAETRGIKDAGALSGVLQARNKQALAKFLVEKMPLNLLETPSVRPTRSQAQEILQSAFSHPVIGDSAAKKYDTYSETGFCFGRAAFVHLALLNMGVKPEHIAKVFVMGGLYREGVGWDYHVATTVLSSEGHWLVIDTLAGEVLSLQSWMKKVSEWDGNRVHPKLRFYFTEATKFLPLSGTYESARLASPIYKGYFVDLEKWYAKNVCQKFYLKENTK